MANVHVYQLVLELTKALQELQSDPQTFETKVKKAYEISAAQKAVLEEARKTIAEGKITLETIKTRNAALESMAQGLDQRRSELDRNAEQQSAKEAQLNALKSQLDTQAEDQKTTGALHGKLQTELETRNADLLTQVNSLDQRDLKFDQREQAIAAKEAEVAKYEAGLKERAAELKRHAEGL